MDLMVKHSEGSGGGGKRLMGWDEVPQNLQGLLTLIVGVGVVCGGVWCGVVWCGVVWCGVVWCGVVRCVMVIISVFLFF